MTLVPFALYLAWFPTYRLIYGAFATIPIFLIWLYVSWLVVLAGAAFNFIGHSPRASGLSIGMRSAMGSPLPVRSRVKRRCSSRDMSETPTLLIHPLTRLITCMRAITRGAWGASYPSIR